MSKHTPGPWARRGGKEANTVVIESGKGSAVAFMQGYGEEVNANARLIAAAPELLLELTRLSREVGGILYGFERELREAIGNTNFAVLRQKVKEAEAAIQKVEAQ